MLADVLRRIFGTRITPIFDDFNRANNTPLHGNPTSDGNAVWENLRVSGGVWETWNNRARYTGSDNDHAVAIVEAHTPDVDITLNTAISRDALVFRANDADNYFFAVSHYNTNSFACGTTTKYCTGSNWNCCNATNNSPCTNAHAHGCGNCNSNTTACCCTVGSYNHTDHLCTHQHTTSCANSNNNTYACGENTNWCTGYTYQVRFYKRVSGSVQTAASTVNANSVNSIRVRAVGNSISFFVNGSNTANRNLTDSFNGGANKHGIGRYPQGLSVTTQLDNFNLVPVEE